jgi:hypothetical protein
MFYAVINHVAAHRSSRRARRRRRGTRHMAAAANQHITVRAPSRSSY